MERDRTGWDRKIGREGGKRICMDGQAFWEWESPGFLLVFRSLSPIILWICSSSFFQQFKNSPSFDLCYYTALFFFWRGERAPFLRFSFLVLLLLLLLLFLFFGSVFILICFLGCPLFVSLCLSRLLFNLAERKWDGKTRTTTTGIG